MPRYRLRIEYDGTPYVGWQRQDNGPSVQGAIEAAILSLTGETVSIRGAGRTDSGVHAIGQVAHADLSRPWKEHTLRNALNAHLGMARERVAILDAAEVPDDFDARFSAKKRHYLYRIISRKAPLALEANRAWFVARDLDHEVMHEAGQMLVGRHDFTTFRAAQCQANSPIRTIDRLEVTRNGDLIEMRVSAQSFLHNQIRSFAGTLKLAGAEALIRWNHPRDGLLTPDRFLKIAEDLNVMATLDRIVLEKALIDCARWAARGLVMPKISVNVSARRLRDESLIDSLTGLSIQPGQISFELVESIFLDESDDIVLSNLERIKALGIDIEIDDFGTGHTSIVSLLKLKPKRLKIDRQLVAPILKSHNEQALVRSIIEIGRSLNIEIVAEGVETMDHAEMLGLLGCDLLQGYAFAKPLSRDDFLALGSEMRWKLAS